MQGKKKRPFAEDYNMSKITIDNAESMTDCTGLMPRPPLTEEEKESYANIMEFFPDDVVEHNR